MQQAVKDHRAAARTARCVVPPDWPEQLTCPRCQTTRPTAEYVILQRPGEHRRLLARVVFCPTLHCETFFAPTDEYLRATTLVAPLPVPLDPRDANGHTG